MVGIAKVTVTEPAIKIEPVLPLIIKLERNLRGVEIFGRSSLLVKVI